MKRVKKLSQVESVQQLESWGMNSLFFQFEFIINEVWTFRKIGNIKYKPDIVIIITFSSKLFKLLFSSRTRQWWEFFVLKSSNFSWLAL